MPRPSYQLPAFLIEDPTRAEQREALWRMSPAERVAAMYGGDLTLYQCLAWAARYLEEVPTLNGEWWFIAIRTPDIADLDDATADEGIQKCPPQPPSHSHPNSPADRGGVCPPPGLVSR